MLHMISVRWSAHDLHSVMPGLLERTCWRQFAGQWGDCQKSRIAPLNVLIDITDWLNICMFHFHVFIVLYLPSFLNHCWILNLFDPLVLHDSNIYFWSFRSVKTCSFDQLKTIKFFSPEEEKLNWSMNICYNTRSPYFLNRHKSFGCFMPLHLLKWRLISLKWYQTVEHTGNYKLIILCKVWQKLIHAHLSKNQHFTFLFFLFFFSLFFGGGGVLSFPPPPLPFRGIFLKCGCLPCTRYYHLIGLVVKASASRAADQSSIPAFTMDIFPGWVTPVT